MPLDKQKIAEANGSLSDHRADYERLAGKLAGAGADVDAIIGKLADFQVAAPS